VSSRCEEIEVNRIFLGGLRERRKEERQAGKGRKVDLLVDREMREGIGEVVVCCFVPIISIAESSFMNA
jgi:hypothetical protein